MRVKQWARAAPATRRAPEELAALPDRSFDVVLLDPMFRRARAEPAGFDWGLRHHQSRCAYARKNVARVEVMVEGMA